MEENEPIDPDYLKGFNEGYLLTKHEPELASNLTKVEADSERIKGLKAGIEEYTREQHKGRYPSWFTDIEKSINETQDPSPEKDIDLERD